MDKEIELYEAFLNLLLKKVREDTVSTKELEIITDFLKINKIQPVKENKNINEDTKNLYQKAEINELPFDDDERLIK